MTSINKRSDGFRILNWIAIIEQLTRTLASRRLENVGLTYPQFGVLNHFQHQPRVGKTVSGIARAMQQTQPAVTKTVQALVSAGMLSSTTDLTDRRVKWLHLTDRGRKAHSLGVQALGPDIDLLFRHWSSDEMADLSKALDRIKLQLDDNRDPPP